MSEQRGRRLILKFGKPRFRPPPEVNEVIVRFDAEPVRRLVYPLWGARKLVVFGKVLSPEELYGETITAFFNLSANGHVPESSNLAEAVRILVGPEVKRGEELDMQAVFANQTVRASLRRVQTGPDRYAVIDKLLEKT